MKGGQVLRVMVSIFRVRVSQVSSNESITSVSSLTTTVLLVATHNENFLRTKFTSTNLEPTNSDNSSGSSISNDDAVTVKVVVLVILVVMIVVVLVAVVVNVPPLLLRLLLTIIVSLLDPELRFRFSLRFFLRLRFALRLKFLPQLGWHQKFHHFKRGNHCDEDTFLQVAV